MPESFSLVFVWWTYLLVIGLIFWPISRKFFPFFIDEGYVLSKIIGILFLTYSLYALSTLKILGFTVFNLYLLLILLTVATIALAFFPKKRFRKNVYEFILSVKAVGRWVIFEEAIFLVSLLTWSLVRSHSPEIHGIEKYMDFSIINSILRTEYFPAKDPWFANLPINYYYFGHIYSAVLTKLTQIPSSVSFNILIATQFAVILATGFSIGATLIKIFQKEVGTFASHKLLFGGLLSSFLLTLTSNLQVVYSFFKPTDEAVPFWLLTFSPLTFPNSYWYPAATRFVYNTIHEFPAYSLILSDLHAHLLATPFSLLAISLILSIFTQGINLKRQLLTKRLHFIFLCLVLAVLYMTNAWDSVIYLGLSFLTVMYLLSKEKESVIKKTKLFLKFAIFSIILIVIFTLPFSFHFEPFVSGIGINCAPSLLTNIGNVGPFLFEKGYCQKTPLWQLSILYGFFIFFAASFAIFMRGKKKTSVDRFVYLFLLGGFLLTIIPEIIYLKDIYPSHFRANTMFKIAYASFIILSLSTSFIIFRMFSALRLRLGEMKINVLIILFFLTSLFLISIVSIYPLLAINSYYNNLSSITGLDGTDYLRTLHPSDYEAITWINENIKDQEIIAEASGDSYTDFSRISSNTGLINIINWPAHEWLWRGTYEVAAPRVEDLTILYESSKPEDALRVIEKYNITLVYIGEMERNKYKGLDEVKFEEIGELIYEKDKSRIYKISR